MRSTKRQPQSTPRSSRPIRKDSGKKPLQALSPEEERRRQEAHQQRLERSRDRARRQAAEAQRQEQRNRKAAEGVKNTGKQTKGFLANAGQMIMDHKKGFMVLAVVILLVGAIYPPLRDYYCASRDLSLYTEYYHYIVDKNKELAKSNKMLLTPEGLENEFRKRGFIAEGEIPVRIKGGIATEKEVKEAAKKEQQRKALEEKDSKNSQSTNANSKAADSDKDQDQPKQAETKADLEFLVEEIKINPYPHWYDRGLDMLFFYTPPTF